MTGVQTCARPILSASSAGRRMYLPVARNGFVEFVELNSKGSGATALFGNRRELLQEWRDRVSAVPREGSGPVTPDVLR